MISVIIPALNEEKFLPRLLGSIKKQTYEDYEIIVADANSKDKTRQIARQNGCKVVKGGMPAAGRNSGARAAKGDVLLFLDADIQVDRDFLKDSLNELTKRKIDIAGVYIKPLSRNPIDKIFFEIFNLWVFATQLFYPNASGGGIFCKKWLHKKVSGFDETITLSEDMDYAKRCSKLGKFGVLKTKAYVSTRRFENDGRFKVAFKLLSSAIYRIFFGEIRSNIFRYDLRYRK